MNVAKGSADDLSLFQEAIGGKGGYGDNLSQPGRGGYASSVLTGLSLGTVSTNYYVSATGGQGGEALSGSRANGGPGGGALAGFFLKGAGDMYGSASATGGGGGSAYGSGNGGNGASVSLSNAIDGQTSGRLYLTQSAGGGFGGFSNNGNGGQGGSAESRLTGSKDTTRLNLYTLATGGSGGGSSSGQGGKGGDATAYSDATNTGVAEASTAALGGEGGTGKDGGEAKATSLAKSSTSDATVTAFAIGGNGGSAGPNGSAGNGGRATAIATGTASKNLMVSSSAYGGLGRDIFNGYASNGKSGEARAFSTGTASSGSVGAEASITPPPGSTNNNFIVAMAGAPIANGTSRSEASVSIEQPIRNLTEAQSKQAAAFGTTLPNRRSLEPLLAQNQKVNSAITGKPILGYGVLGGTAASNSILYYGDDISGITSQQHLIVGLLDPLFTGPGFDSLKFSIQLSVLDQNGYPVDKLLLDKTFFSLLGAKIFFDNNILDFGPLSDIAGVVQKLSLNFNLELKGANDAGFDFNFIFGGPSPAPIPGAVWLLGSGLIGLLGLKRKSFSLN